jgi:hypothetical protein
MKFLPSRIVKAKLVLKQLDQERRHLEKDEKANPDYWNGDSWGSIQGQRDADEWVDNQLATYLLNQIEELT